MVGDITMRGGGITSVAWVTLVYGNKTDHQGGSDGPL